MKIAEKLYNDGYISYPRTETDVFDLGFDHRALLQIQSSHPVWGSYVKGLLEGGKLSAKRGSHNDKAHPPIHPTGAGLDLKGDSAKIYEFITRRYLACISEDAQGHETCVEVRIGEELFHSKGLHVSELNYLNIYTYEKWTNIQIGEYELDASIPSSQFEIHMDQGLTSPPKLLSEADLISTMDKNGIGKILTVVLGTDATIHEHIAKILDRKYALMTPDRRFMPTKLGIGLVKAFDGLSLPHSLTKPVLRAKLESDLLSICNGVSQRDQILSQYVSFFRNSYQMLSAKFSEFVTSIAGYLDDPFSAIRGDLVRATKGMKRTSADVMDGLPLTHKVPKRANSAQQSAHCSLETHKGSKNKEAAIDIPDPADKKCICNVDAVQRTVVKDGPNKGRKFWTCANGSNQCTYFEWADEAAARVNDENQNRQSGDIRCDCGLIAIPNVTRGGENAGRSYLSCSRSYKRCRFFAWSEQPAPASSNHPQPQRSSARGGGRGGRRRGKSK